ncbi:MAG: tetratricopeptide repeat protein, partial [Nannocystaceae bacterium]
IDWLEVADEELAREILLRRAENLYARLARREDARLCFEEVRKFQSPEGSAWSALATIYKEMSDWTAYTALLEAQHEVLDEDLDIEVLLSAAQTYRDHLDNDERAAHFFYAILARDAFHTEAFEGYKEHWRRKHNWGYLRDVILYQIEQAESVGPDGPLSDPAFAEEFVELADICERRIGDVSGALDAWRRLAEHFPSDPRPTTQIGRIEKRSRMWDNMVKVQEAELARTNDQKSRVAILKRLVQIYRDRQVDPERAIQLYKEILEAAPNDLQSQRALTALYDRASRYEEVVEMLEAQYERSRSRTERCALLRRLGELWHHELKDPERAIWACETILEEDPSDLDAMHRLQLIHQERGQWNLLLKVMSAEVKVLDSREDQMALLRRMARIAGLQLKREDLAFKIWKQLHSLDPTNLEIIDTLVTYYDQHGPEEALAELLDTAGNSETTPKIRKLDYALRLGWLARDRMVDVDRAQAAFERARELRDDHRGALQALADIYREKDLFGHLCVVLQHLQKTADTEGEAWSLASERANYLVEHLDRPEDAAAVLVTASRELVDSGSELNLRIMDCYEAAADHRGLTLHAELALLSADTTPERSTVLFEKIIEARAEVGDLVGALSAAQRGLRV